MKITILFTPLEYYNSSDISIRTILPSIFEHATTRWTHVEAEISRSGRGKASEVNPSFRTRNESGGGGIGF